MQLDQSAKLAGIHYDIRGPVLAAAQHLESEGHHVLKLHIGNPAPFGFEAPESLLREMVRNLPSAHGYGDAKGLLAARQAVVDYYLARGVVGVDTDDVYLGNGVSELIVMALQALLNPGDEVLIPSPDYPLWTAATTLAGGTPVHYPCDEQAGWYPDLAAIAAAITPATRAIVLINPNNPTGAVYSDELMLAVAELARRHNLVIFSDEIYDRILYGDTTHTSIAALAPDVFCMTLGGLSKVYRVPGFRAGWLVVSGPQQHARGYLDGLDTLANLRLCPNVPAQYAIEVALGGRQDIVDLVLPGGRLLQQRDRAVGLLNDIPGVSCVVPGGAFYAFPRLDPRVYPIVDDERFVLDLLRREKILVMHGTGFNWPRPDHFRVVTLQPVDDLEAAIRRIGRFLEGYRQE